MLTSIIDRLASLVSKYLVIGFFVPGIDVRIH